MYCGMNIWMSGREQAHGCDSCVLDSVLCWTLLPCHLWPGQSLTKSKDNAQERSAVITNMVGQRMVEDSPPTAYIWCLYYLIHLLGQRYRIQIEIQKVRHVRWRKTFYFPYKWYFQHFNYEVRLTRYFILLSPLRLKLWNINTSFLFFFRSMFL